MKKSPIITHIIVRVNNMVNFEGENTNVGREKRDSIRNRAAKAKAINAFG